MGSGAPAEALAGGASGSGRDRYEAVMRHVFDVKSAAASLARSYVRGEYGAVIRYAREVWGFVPTYMMEPYPLDVKRGAASTVLAAHIAEHYMLYLVHRKMKNVIISIVGMGGSGKTTYAVLSCMGAYLLAGVRWETALRLVSSSVFFDLKPFVDGVSKVIKTNLWLPCIVADDIGEWITKYWRDVKLMGVIDFFNLLEQAKDWTGVIIFTARSFKGSVAKAIRDKSDLVVEAGEHLLDMHRLDLFEWYRLQDWSEKDTRAKKRRMLYLDPVPATAKMPDEIWQAMRRARRELAEKSLERLEKLSELLPLAEKQALEAIEKRYSQAGK